MPKGDWQRESGALGSVMAGPAVPVLDGWMEPDHVLACLVELVNEVGFGLRVRLLAGGMMLSGLLVSGDEYFDLLSRTMREAGQAAPSAAAESFGSLVDLLDGAADEFRAARSQAGAGRRLAYVHLREAEAAVPGQRAVDIGLWRGRIADVTGWSIGFGPGGAHL